MKEAGHEGDALRPQGVSETDKRGEAEKAEPFYAELVTDAAYGPAKRTAFYHLNVLLEHGLDLFDTTLRVQSDLRRVILNGAYYHYRNDMTIWISSFQYSLSLGTAYSSRRGPNVTIGTIGVVTWTAVPTVGSEQIAKHSNMEFSLTSRSRKKRKLATDDDDMTSNAFCTLQHLLLAILMVRDGIGRFEGVVGLIDMIGFHRHTKIPYIAQ